MKTIGRSAGQVMLVVWLVLLVPGWARAQTSGDPLRAGRVRGEVTGVLGGSTLILGDGGLILDGMWGLKLGALSRNRRFGIEGTFEQSIREPEFRYAGGDFVLQFPKQDKKRPILFLHGGAGALLYSRDSGVLSFGGGVKQYINERLGVRVGVQDRMLFRTRGFHRLDFYCAILVAF